VSLPDISRTRIAFRATDAVLRRAFTSTRRAFSEALRSTALPLRAVLENAVGQQGQFEAVGDAALLEKAGQVGLAVPRKHRRRQSPCYQPLDEDEQLIFAAAELDRDGFIPSEALRSNLPSATRCRQRRNISGAISV
jgi:hypothetical protein